MVIDFSKTGQYQVIIDYYRESKLRVVGIFLEKLFSYVN